MRFRRWKKVSDEDYKRRCLENIRDNVRDYPDLFRQLLERDVITITCYCGKHKTFCHRYMLADYVLPRCANYFGLSYHYMGER